jgi:16S rRNA (guanine527-N7)-methyltransferase
VTPSSPTQDELTEALGMAQRFGALGPGSIEATIEHAGAFVAALEDVRGRVIDLGSGGGVPGLVIAVERPDLEVVLVDRREKRTDLCRRMTARLRLSDRVRVLTADVGDLDALAPMLPADAVVARGFGPPDERARHAAPLLRLGGSLVVSEPPGDHVRWHVEALAALGLREAARLDAPARVVRFERFR